MIKAHRKWNIEFETIEGHQLAGLNAQQGKAIAEMINSLRQRLAEAEFMLSLEDPIPDELKFSHPTNDYKERR